MFRKNSAEIVALGYHLYLYVFVTAMHQVNVNTIYCMYLRIN